MPVAHPHRMKSRRENAGADVSDGADSSIGATSHLDGAGGDGAGGEATGGDAEPSDADASEPPTDAAEEPPAVDAGLDADAAVPCMVSAPYLTHASYVAIRPGD